MRTKLANLFVALSILSGGVAAADTRSSTDPARDHRVTEVAPAPVQVAGRDDRRDGRNDRRDDRAERRDDRADQRTDRRDDRADQRSDRRDDRNDRRDDRADQRNDRRDDRNDRRDDRAGRDDTPRTAPPAAPMERARARRGYVFIAGNYQYQAGAWVWIPGHYERSVANQQYRNGSWNQQGDGFVWNAGGWVNVGHRR